MAMVQPVIPGSDRERRAYLPRRSVRRDEQHDQNDYQLHETVNRTSVCARLKEDSEAIGGLLSISKTQGALFQAHFHSPKVV